MARQHRQMSDAKGRLLLAEDDPVNQKLLGLFLRKRGYDVTTVDDGQQCLDLLAQDPDFDLLILDDMMPRVSGIDVLLRLRADQKTRLLPVIMATARSAPEDIVRALDAGANDYVSKPFDLAVLQARVAARLRSDRQRKSTAAGDASDASADANAKNYAPLRSPSATHYEDVRPGAVLGGRYLLEQQIGEGAYGTVYAARHMGLDNQVAIKVLRGVTGHDDDERTRLRAEGMSTCRITHPNAVRVLDFEAGANGLSFLVMELLEGRGLDEEMRTHGRLSASRCLEILLPACYVLADAHRQEIVHRDIKPANIFLHQSRGAEVVKVLDFGIAKFIGDHAPLDHQSGDAILGSPAYMAPERVGRQPYDGKADVYALAISVFEMLTGMTPFGGEENNPVQVAVAHLRDQPPLLQDILPSLSPQVCAAVHAGLQKDPAHRPSAEMFAISFAEAVTD